MKKNSQYLASTTMGKVLFGDTQGPRFGSFVALYGVRETVVLIKDALEKNTQRPT